MKIICAFLALFSTLLPATAAEGRYQSSDFDSTARFIFYSVLEGLYEDGLTTSDVDQILMKRPGESYFHFIYACPVCTPTIWALESYRNRPRAFYSLKTGHEGTFGPGLSNALHRQLYSDNPQQRLAAINTLMQTWMARRMDAMRLSPAERADLLGKLEVKRKDGMHDLESFRHPMPGQKVSVGFYAPAYLDIDECAVCNGAVGKPMKLPGSPKDH